MPSYELKINGENRKISADADTPLLWVLRDELNLVGTKYGCGIAQCGACTVHLNGKAVRSCSIPIEAINGKDVVTIEGLDAEAKHPLQNAWREHDVPQCGYCQAGQIMSAAALLKKTPAPTDEQIDNYMRGNLCRCGTYTRIKKAIKSAAKIS